MERFSRYMVIVSASVGLAVSLFAVIAGTAQVAGRFAGRQNAPVQAATVALASTQGTEQNVSTQACLSLTRTLSRGMSGSAVISLQNFLISEGVLTIGNATGFFGPLTEAAVQKWQSRHGIVSAGDPETTGYGVVGPRTRKAMANCAQQNSKSNPDGVPRSSSAQPNSTISNLVPNTTPATTGSNPVSRTASPTTGANSVGWPTAPGASTVDGEMAPFLEYSGPGPASWLQGDKLGNYLYGPHAQEILHGTGGGFGDTGNTSGRTLVSCADIAQLPGLAVILVAGQSNGANSASGEQIFTTNNPIYNFNIGDGKCYGAKEPVLGTDKKDANSQAFILPLASHLVDAGLFKTVLIVPVNVSGTLIEEWRPDGGKYFNRIKTAIDAIKNNGLAPTFILWHQGEGNAGGFIHSNTPDPGSYHIDITPDLELAGTLNWMQNFFKIVAAIRAQGVTAPVFPALATRCGDSQTSSVIRKAQTSVVDAVWGIYQGPDTDAIDLRRSDDGCHFNSAGNLAHAQAWFNVLRQYVHTVSITSTDTDDVRAGATLFVKGTGFAASNEILLNGARITTVGSTDGTTLSFVVPSLTAPGSYILTIRNTNGTSNKRDLRVYSNAPGVALTINGQSAFTVELGDSYTLSYASQNVASCMMAYTNSGTGQSGSYPLSPNTSGSASTGLVGSYTLTCKDAQGTQVSKTVTITLATAHTPVQANLSVTPTSGTAPLSVSFTANTAGTVDFGDSQTGTLNEAATGCSGCSPTYTVGHSYASAGTYSAKLQGTSAGVTVTVTAIVNPPPSISLSAGGQSSLSIKGGESYNIAYGSSNVTSCTMTYADSSGVHSYAVTPNTSGTAGTGLVGYYTFSCMGANGADVWKSVTITALPSADIVASGGPSVGLNANGQTNLSVTGGGSYTLSYGSENASSCTMYYAGSGGVNSYPVTPNTYGTPSSSLVGYYTLSCSNASGVVTSKSVTISAQPPADSN